MFFPTLGMIATTDVVSVTLHQTIQEALTAMHAHDHRKIVVINQNVYYVLTTQDMIGLKISGIDFNTQLSQVVLLPHQLNT
jgi:CBS domain-containing protein